MCRIFGFRSTLQSQVHRSLVQADGALGRLSNEHPDGWGVAYYLEGTPHLMRSPATALSDQVFHRLSGVVASETVLAHVRKATQGDVSVLNCHPFQHGRWTFVHNGDIPNFAARRRALFGAVAPRLQRFILGDTDSEVLFYLVLSELQRYGSLARRLRLEDVTESLRKTLSYVRSECDDAEHTSLLTVVLTDGESMVAVEGGKPLYWSTHKTRCSERGECPLFAPECEAPSTDGFVNHLLFASEPLAGENVWTKLETDEIVGVDGRMQLTRSHLHRRRLTVAI